MRRVHHSTSSIAAGAQWRSLPQHSSHTQPPVTYQLLQAGVAAALSRVKASPCRQSQQVAKACPDIDLVHSNAGDPHTNSAVPPDSYQHTLLTALLLVPQPHPTLRIGGVHSLRYDWPYDMPTVLLLARSPVAQSARNHWMPGSGAAALVPSSWLASPPLGASLYIC
jgi:hypothetical protein